MENLSKSASNQTDFDTVGLLKSGCQQSLSQCKELLELLSEDDYRAGGEHSSSIGGHVRHILDRFQSFFHGLPLNDIDYDDRERDKSIEGSLAGAKVALTSVLQRLNALTSSEVQSLALTVSETVNDQGVTVRVSSTAQRELMGLVTHSIHHLAIIALIAKGLGYTVDQRFGKAPSTLVFESY
jgi:uncharacterized damage-inducible protein DinB